MKLLSKNQFKLLFLIAAILFLMIPAANAQYPLGDTLTYILRPILNIPSIVPAGQSFNIEVEAGQFQQNWQGELLLGNLSYDLPITGAFYLDGANRWLIMASAPTGIPYELYDLHIISEGIDDTTKHSVKIIDQYRTDFYFIQITDAHMPTSTYHYEDGGLTDTTSMSDMWSLIQDFEILNPEFVLFTGDIVNEGELEDYMDLHCYSRAKNLISNFTVPVYVGGGNHDLGGWDDTPPEDGTARRDWWKFFGWKYLDQTEGPGPYTQDYFFDYGTVRFIELEAYDNYDGWRSWIYSDESFTMLQRQWLADVVAATPATRDLATFIHYDFNGGLDIEGLGIDLNVYGHIHYDLGSIDTYPYNLATNNVCNGERGFRVIRYDETGFHPQLTFSSGSYGQSLTSSYSPSNDGSSDTVVATIHNTYGFSFNHARVVFNMPPADTFDVSYGELKQVIDTGDIMKCYVEFNLPTHSTVEITITGEGSPFVPGDANGNGEVLSSDVTYLVNYLGGRRPAPSPIYAGDANGDCEVSGEDVTYLANYIHATGPAPVDGNCE